MSAVHELMSSELKCVNIGLEAFADDLSSQSAPVAHVYWKPPANGDPELNEILKKLYFKADEIDAANKKAMDLLQSAQPVWVDVGLAKDVIPGFTEKTVALSGPPVTWDKMCGPQKGSVMGALIYEGLAKDADEAVKLAESGEITFSPCHHFNAVGPMAGATSANMPVLVIENKNSGNRAYSCFNTEGKGRPLTFGAYGEDTQEMLRFLRDTVAPAMKAAIDLSGGGIDLKSIMAKAMHMGDDCHNRLIGATALLWQEVIPLMAKAYVDYDVIEEIGNLIKSNPWFFLNYSMAASKASLDAARNVPMSTLVVAMARNGTEVGIQVSGLQDEWFTAPAPFVKGMYFPGFCAEDANPDMGDSAITETNGLGGCAMAAALSMTQLVGGTIDDAIGFSKKMAEITLEDNKSYTIPQLNFKGTPTGFDVIKVIETGITPIINTGIAHKKAGEGIIGAGMTSMPYETFTKALKAMRKFI